MLDSWSTISVLFMNDCRKNNCFGPKLEPNYTKIALYSDHRLVRFETVLVNSTVLEPYNTA
jgi:hypothetical protein